MHLASMTIAHGVTHRILESIRFPRLDVTTVTYSVLMSSFEVREYIRRDGTSPFGEWFAALNGMAAARVTVALSRIAAGNLSNVKGVGANVLEYRIDFGPGYRIYLGLDGAALVILLCGGTKHRQQRDIDTAHMHWQDYKVRKQRSED